MSKKKKNKKRGKRPVSTILGEGIPLKEVAPLQEPKASTAPETEETTSEEAEKVISVTISHRISTGLKIQAAEGTNIDDLDKLIRAAEVELTNTRLSALESAARQQSQALRETISILETVAAKVNTDDEEAEEATPNSEETTKLGAAATAAIT